MLFVSCWLKQWHRGVWGSRHPQLGVLRVWRSSVLCGLAAGAIKVGRQWVEVWCHYSEDHEQVGDGACQYHQTDRIFATAFGEQL